MDITERKLAEEASVRLTHELEQRVRERTASLLRTQRLSQTGSSSWNVSTGEIVWSEETYRIFGFDPGVKITPEMVASRIHPMTCRNSGRCSPVRERIFNSTIEF